MKASSTRQTQLQRSESMKVKLLDATLALIREEGWSKVSTQKICARAKVSRGAQTHHFPSKDSLLIAAVQELVNRYQRELDAVFAKDKDHAPSLESLFEFLWDACFDGPLLDCWMDVLVAARTDKSLRENVRTPDRRALSVMRELGDECDTSNVALKGSPADIVELTVYLLRGMVVQNGVHAAQEQRRELFNLWKRMVLGT